MSATKVNENPPEDKTESKDKQAKKQIWHKIQSDGQSTSSGIKTDYSDVLAAMSLVNSHRSDSLSSLDELAELLLRSKVPIENDESFVTVDGCRQDIMTSTDPTIIFSVNERTQNIITLRDQPSNYPPPPPYDYNAPPRYQNRLGQTPVYQERYIGQASSGPGQDASGSPPYRRNYEPFDEVTDTFISTGIRNKFIQKVYLILCFQLLITFGFITLCLLEKRVKHYVMTSLITLLISGGIYITTVIIIFCYKQARRIFPLNFILLTLLTLSMAYLTASISCYYDTYIVLVAFGVTAGICVLISIISCQTKFDVTECGMVLCLASFIIMIYGVIAMVISMLTQSNITFLIYSCLMTLLFCMYLMYDTQQILGGRRIELSPEEYILGALTLYIDFMVIFQNLLYIFGSLSSNT